MSLTTNTRTELLMALMPSFENAYALQHTRFPGVVSILAEYDTSVDDEILELTMDFHPDLDTQDWARELLKLRKAQRGGRSWLRPVPAGTPAHAYVPMVCGDCHGPHA